MVGTGAPGGGEKGVAVKRTWTAAEADEWTREDAVAAALGVLSFIAIAFGTPYAFLLQPVGFALLGGGLLLGGLMLWIAWPKLDAVSSEYEKKQRHYLEHLEKVMKWEDLDD